MKTIVTLTGPSCAGKSTLEKALKLRGFGSIRSATTRPQRSNEQDGIDYDFMTVAAFEKLGKDGGLVESTQFNGNRYGAPTARFEELFAQNVPIVIVVEPHGRKQIEAYGVKMGWRVIRVFVDGNYNVIARRFLTRMRMEMSESGTGPLAVIETYAKRLVMMQTTEAAWRAEAYMTLDHSAYDFTVVDYNEQNADECPNMIVGMVYQSPALQSERSVFTSRPDPFFQTIGPGLVNRVSDVRFTGTALGPDWSKFGDGVSVANANTIGGDTSPKCKAA